MQYSPNAVKAGVGMFAAFGVSVGLLMYFLVNESSDLFGDDFEDIGIFIAFIGLIIAALFSPILAVIVGAIIAKDFDDEGDAAFNGALAGAGGSILMVMIAVFITSLAMDDAIDDSDLSDDEAEDAKDAGWDMVVKVIIPSAVGGGLGAFVGFRYLWAQLPSGEMHAMMSSASPPQIPPASPPQP